MVKMNIHLDESLKQYMDQQIANGQYASADELIAELLRNRASKDDGAYTSQRDFGDEHPQALRMLIEQGITSGPAQPWTSENFDAMRQRLLSRQRSRG